MGNNYWKPFSLESEREQDLGALAETISDCTVLLNRGKCKEEDCNGCPIDRRLERCMSQLPDCDRLIVDNMAAELYSRRAFQLDLDSRPYWKKMGERVKEVAVGFVEGLGWCVFMVLTIFIVGGFGCIVWQILKFIDKAFLK